MYFNIDQGIEEGLHVFLNPNEVSHRFSNFSGGSFCIAETGFGTGLNFLITVNEWPEEATGSLHYISVEKHPLTTGDLKLALSQWPQFSIIADKLLEQYPLATEGFHRLEFPNNVTLTLLFGDAAESFSQLEGTVNAWYLDGFAPSKNPEMWSAELFHEIARLSKLGTTFSTFTAAGVVRRGLQDVGFDVYKKKGFGRKREMLAGRFVETKAPIPHQKLWFHTPHSELPEHVAVVGGGLAGCSTAYSLAKRGVSVTLIEKEEQLATGGSGNRQGALYAKLPVKPTVQGELHLSGFLHSIRLLKQLDPDETLWSQCGVAQLATNNKEAARQSDMIEGQYYPDELVQYKTSTELSKIAGSLIEHSGLFFPDAGWVSPSELCRRLTLEADITIKQGELAALTYSDKKWALSFMDNSTLAASHLIICGAEESNRFTQTSHLPLKTIRGQVSITPKTPAPIQAKLNTVVCGEGYISPQKDDQLCFGATFDLKGKELNVTQQDHDKNLVNLTTVLPNIADSIDATTLQGRTAFRCSTPDYLPVVGPAPVYDSYLQTFAKLRKDKNWRFGDTSAEYFPNLYINTGHGSKGLITCPISAELLASIICSEPLPLPKTLIDAVHPARFIIKNLIKQAI